MPIDALIAASMILAEAAAPVTGIDLDGAGTGVVIAFDPAATASQRTAALAATTPALLAARVASENTADGVRRTRLADVRDMMQATVDQCDTIIALMQTAATLAQVRNAVENLGRQNRRFAHALEAIVRRVA